MYRGKLLKKLNYDLKMCIKQKGLLLMLKMVYYLMFD